MSIDTFWHPVHHSVVVAGLLFDVGILKQQFVCTQWAASINLAWMWLQNCDGGLKMAMPLD